MYVAYLHNRNLKSSTVKVYLAAVRNLHVTEGYGNPLEGCLRVKQAVRALEINGEAPKQKMAITLDIMSKIHGLIQFQNFDQLLFWAAMTLAHFGCLRCAEFTVPNQLAFNPSIHLNLNDIVFHNLSTGEKFFTIQIKRSKTDRKNLGFTIYIGCSGHQVCGYCAMHAYYFKHSQKGKTGPLFQFSNGCVMTRALFVQQTKMYLSLLGFNSSQYSGHSFRSGGATTAAAAGLLDWEIKLLGRWTSDAYRRYIRTPVAMLVKFSQRMTSQRVLNTFYTHSNPYTPKYT